MANNVQLSKQDAERLKAILSDHVMWAQVFVVTYDSALKKYTPWTARWYQAEMLRDNSLKKVARCGRRTGRVLPLCPELLEVA